MFPHSLAPHQSPFYGSPERKETIYARNRASTSDITSYYHGLTCLVLRDR